MRPAHVRERPFGMRYYASSTPGIGGHLRERVEDFRVIERRGVEPAPIDANPGDYPYLLVEVTLSDWDTHRFVDALAGGIGIHRERIAWAGTKDARAVTTQLISIRGIEPDALPSLPEVDLRPVGRFGRQLEFGDHAGNRFAITVRGASALDRIDTISAELDRGDGTVVVPNFYGPQRFGIRRPVTHRVGFAIIRGSVRDAVERYLTDTTPHEPERTRTARATLKEAIDAGDWTAARACIPGYLQHERRLVETIASADRFDDVTARDALEALPWALRRLFVHAAQSYLFNEVVSERLRRGIALDAPIEGDWIGFVDDDGSIDVDRPQVVTADRLVAARRHVERGRAAVLAPLVGHRTDLPPGEMGTIVRAVLDRLDLVPSDFTGRDPFDEAGSARPIALETAVAVEGDPPQFTFDLPPGAYATVVLREYCKADPLAMV